MGDDGCGGRRTPPQPTDRDGEWKPGGVNKDKWIEMPLDGKGQPRSIGKGGWMNPQDPHTTLKGHLITYDDKTKVFRIVCSGHYYDVPWADICNPSTPTATGRPTDDPCRWGRAVDEVVVTTVSKKIYMREEDCNILVTCVLEYSVVTVPWSCTGGTQFEHKFPDGKHSAGHWKAGGAGPARTEYRTRTTTFPCC